jgi:cardiolipin synthase
MNTIIISRSYRRAVITWTDFLRSTGPNIPSRRANDDNSIGYWRQLPRRAIHSHPLKKAQYYFRPQNSPQLSSVNRNPPRYYDLLMHCRSTCGIVLRTIGGGNCTSLKSTFTLERRWLSGTSTKGKSTEPEKIFVDTRPLNHQATMAILSQLSSPPNLLTLSRILVTPYLSYILISNNRKSDITTYTPTTATEGDTLASAASSPISSEIINSTIDFSADAATSIFTNVDQLSPEIALILFLAMGFTDFLDGYIARAFPSTATVLGTYLDPFADKFFISIMSMTLWYIGSLPGLLVGLWIARDVGIVGSVYWLVRKETIKRQGSKRNNAAVMDPQNTPLKVQASFTSKVNTTLQIGLIALGIAGEIPYIEIHPMLMTSLIWITAGTTIGSSLGYLDGSAMKNTGNK